MTLDNRAAVSGPRAAPAASALGGPTRAAPALECRGLSKTYGSGRVVLDHLDFTLASGEFVAVMGDSGVGKSTLLNLIAGLDTADSGEVRIDGMPMTQLDDDAATRLRRGKLGFVFQAFHVLPHLTLAQNVAVPLLLNGLPRARATEMLDAVGLRGRGGDFPRQLSGGELQRVAIARALAHRPRLILADEPTGNLDPDTAHEVLALLRAEIKATGAAAIMVTHSTQAAASADRVLILRAGGLHDARAGDDGRDAHEPGSSPDTRLPGHDHA
ncbi:ABC transporter ATP-binding protein [Robbsia sp. Bb-Pol-6]|uniref:ABC transporter ATP-binding protein n=1 Tax=Robbsia betulipollinis TaxID=2981849 RepID=A0ABT3ZJ78_9BURK|nr:ABC transporter ATP-binding protein [Robbsia betulipollinis]MCY0386556.1 ABC transporter ATP-binding protein [Robbsia betulipollinis]